MAEIKSIFPAESVAASLALPVPTLAFDFRMSVKLNPRISVGEGPWGARSWISFESGQWSASWGHGTLVPGGQDSLLVNPQNLHAYVDTNYLLQTADDPPAYIAVKTTGWRTGTKEVLDRLLCPTQADQVDPSEYSFRIVIKLETGDERYKDMLNTGIWIGSAARRSGEVIYDAYKVT